MGFYSQVDVDLQDLLATILTVGAEYDLDNPDSESGMDGRAILYSRMTALGWAAPTEIRVTLRNANVTIRRES